jgi:pyridoxal phosphate enzyme (YggS family)
MKEVISDNLRELRGRIAQACEEYERDTDDITIVAVSKSHPPEAIQRVVATGIRDIGESKIQEAEPKIETLGRIARFHMVGHLQTNKVKKAVELFDVIQSVDSFKLAEEINRRAGEREWSMECYLEVNSSGESQKYGVAPDDTIALVEKVRHLSNIQLTGLMTVGPLTDDEDAVRRAFARCHDLYRQARDMVGNDFDTLSMGMSHDFQLAIAEKSTMIRIGTAIFGPREIQAN